MKSFNKIAIASSILFIALMIIWPLQQPEDLPSRSDSLLNIDILGDGSELARPIPTSITLDAATVALGERLFNDSGISGNGFSCNTCHQLNHAGIDQLSHSLVTGGGFDEMNTPTIFNVALNSLHSWTGEFTDLESQLDRVVNSPKHFASNWPAIIQHLQQDGEYRSAFKKIFGGAITRQTISIAITTFERSLLTPDADFDRYLRGDRTALTGDQQKGYRLFINYGCISCHQGINLGGNLLARFGIFKDGFSDKSALSQFDYGRYNITGKQRDKFVFRVPSLRNVAATAPYFHGGDTQTLGEAIKTMARIQLNIEMPQPDVNLIESFLHSLSGEYRGNKL
jgi:cytochrome c peroxidase